MMTRLENLIFHNRRIVLAIFLIPMFYLIIARLSEGRIRGQRPTVEAAPEPIAEIMPETNEMPTSSLPADSTDFTETSVKQTSPKYKSLPPPAPRAKKPTLPATKKTPAQKKAVTVDDLISDN